MEFRTILAGWFPGVVDLTQKTERDPDPEEAAYWAVLTHVGRLRSQLRGRMPDRALRERAIRQIVGEERYDRYVGRKRIPGDRPGGR